MACIGSYNPTVVDLFAGAGGLSLGFEWAGARILQAVELDDWAAQTFRHNIPEAKVLVRDVRTLTDEEIRTLFEPNPTFVIGGPPCQGFSISNQNKDPRDPRNSLFREFIRFVRLLKPTACLIENVRGLASARTETREPVLAVIAHEFKRLEYVSSATMLNAADFGVPQRRERVFIVAFRAGCGEDFAWPEATYNSISMGQSTLVPSSNKRYVTLWESLSDLPQITFGSPYPRLTYAVAPQNPYQAMMRVGAKEPIMNHEPMRHTPRIVERFSHIGYGQSESDSPDDLRPRVRSSPSESSTVTYDQNSRRQRPDQPCSTITATSYTNFIHPFLDRNFTVRELARIQSFPDRYQFMGKRAVLSVKLSTRKGLEEDVHLDQRKQVGNAVPPILAKAIAYSMIEALRTQSPKVLS